MQQKAATDMSTGSIVTQQPGKEVNLPGPVSSSVKRGGERADPGPVARLRRGSGRRPEHPASARDVLAILVFQTDAWRTAHAR